LSAIAKEVPESGSKLADDFGRLPREEDAKKSSRVMPIANCVTGMSI
jgi:hypothetical protein